MIKKINLKLNKKIFKPTGTSDLMINSISKHLKLRGDVLDLGAGSGYIGLSLLRIFKNKFDLFASDLANSSIKIIKDNANTNKCDVKVKKGNLFNPWKNQKFDFIINDVSGVAEKIAQISPWFKFTSCKSGKDGTKLTLKVLGEAKKYLKENGVICFPVLSFSDSNKIISFAKSKFQKVRKINKKKWPLPKEMIKDISTLEKLKKKGYINFEKKFGIIIWSTEIYLAYDKIN